ncbi:MAG: toxic anion resistance protein [Lachnospiraceae bacterium]|nr:toxic anion resistance protein [Lachnospiraceae bacterium]
MSNEFDMEAPTLTLDPVLDMVKTKPGVPAEKPQEAPPQMDDSILNDAERAQVAAFSNQIDLTDSAVILQYGAGTQQKMADFSQKALDNVRTQDLGEIGNLLNGVVKELRNFDDKDEEKGFFGFFKKSANKIEDMKARYDRTEVTVSKISNALEAHQVQLLKDSSMLDQMYQMNLGYFKELTMYVLAGKQKLQETENGKLKELREKAQQTGLAEDAQAANDLQGACERFEKKLHDLELTRTIAMQTAPQIRMIQSNDTMMAEKIQSTLVNTIPLWKSQMVLALGVEHSTQAAKAQRAVSDMTNELLQKNAAMLKQATVETAKESQRGIVDMETLKQTNESLITTLDEVMNIQAEGRQKRQEAEVELAKMEQDLKTKLLDVRNNTSRQA